MDAVTPPPGLHSERIRPLYRTTQIVWYIFWAVETILLFRFLLRFIGANPSAGFTELIYALSYPFMAPFFAIVSSPSIAGSVIEWSTLIAMLVYWVLAWGIIRLIVIGKPVTRVEAQQKLNQQDVL